MVNGVKKMSSMWSSYKKGARLLAIAEGKEQGIAEGKEQGRAEEKARAVRSMAHTAIRTGLPVDDALLLFDEEYRPLIREEMERIRSQEA